jgi:hypothetical protein
MKSLMICFPRPIFLGDKLEMNGMGGARSTYGERRGVYRVLVRKYERKRPLRKPRGRWEDNIQMDLEEVGWGYGTDRAGSGQGQVASMNAVMNLRVP